MSNQQQQQLQQNQQRSNEEDQQQQQLQRNSKEDELRNTLKKCPPKVNGAKLPDAFSNINLIKKQKNQPQLGQLNGKIAQLGKQIDPIKNLENMVEQQEYKVVQNLLQPISVNEDRAEKDAYIQEQSNRRIQMQLQQQQQQQQSAHPHPFKSLSTNHNSNNLKNPLAPLKSYMMNIQQLQENLKEQMSDISNQKYQLYDPSKQSQSLQQQLALQQPSRIKLEEMITLGVMKGSRQSGTVKKMLHAPTLKLYAVKEEPVPNKDVRIVLRDWAVFWQSKLHQTGRHVKLYGTFWNTPEGCVSILTELMSANSLQNLLDSCSTLPEGVIKKIAPTIISALQDIHSLSPQCYGSLTPSQILFKPDGSLKLSLGIAYRTCPQQAGQFFSNGVIQQSRSIGDRINMQDPVAITSPSPSITKIANNNGQPSLNEQIQKADDVFRLGFLILTCAVGSLDILQHQGLFFECIQVLLDQANKTESNSTNNKGQNSNSPPQLCCLLHSEQIINEIIIQKINLQQSQSQLSSNSSAQSQKSFLSLNDLLTPKRYSEEFLSFLCQALKFNWQKRATLQQLKAHPFLAQQDTPAAPSSSKSSKGLPLSIHELLKISSQWNRSEYQQPLPLEHQGISEQQLDRLCDAMLLVLPNCQKWFTATNYMEYTKHIKHLQKDSTYLRALAKDLGINAELVYDKITQVYQHIPFIQQLKQQQQIQGKGNNNNNSISNQQMQQKSDFINQQ